VALQIPSDATEMVDETEAKVLAWKLTARHDKLVKESRHKGGPGTKAVPGTSKGEVTRVAISRA